MIDKLIIVLIVGTMLSSLVYGVMLKNFLALSFKSTLGAAIGAAFTEVAKVVYDISIPSLLFVTAASILGMLIFRRNLLKLITKKAENRTGAENNNPTSLHRFPLLNTVT